MKQWVIHAIREGVLQHIEPVVILVGGGRERERLARYLHTVINRPILVTSVAYAASVLAIRFFSKSSILSIRYRNETMVNSTWMCPANSLHW